MKNFKEIMMKAKKGDILAKETLLNMYRPLLLKEAVTGSGFDEDLYQILCYRFICCIDDFKL